MCSVRFDGNCTDDTKPSRSLFRLSVQAEPRGALLCRVWLLAGNLPPPATKHLQYANAADVTLCCCIQVRGTDPNESFQSSAADVVAQCLGVLCNLVMSE